MPPDPDAVHGGNAHSSRAMRVKAIVSFAGGVVRRLTEALDEPAMAEKLSSELLAQVKLINETSHGIHGLHGNADLDSEGTKLWNLCMKLRQSDAQRQSDLSADRKALLLCARVFAFQVLDLSGWHSNSDYPQVLRLFNLSLRTGLSCLREDNVELAKIVLQRTAIYNGHVQNLSQSQTLAQEEMGECRQLKAQFLVLRITLAWKENQFQVAEHMFHETEPLRPSLKPPAAEKLADLIFEIGKDLASRKDFPMAATWLQRAYDMPNEQGLEQLSRDAIELRLTVAQTLVTTLLGIQTNESYERAQNMVQYIRSEIGDGLIVLLLNLEVLNKAPAEVFEADAYRDTLKRMIRIFNHQEPNFKLLTHHIRKLHDRSPSLSMKVLDEFLLTLTGPEQNDCWVENLVIVRMWMTTSQTDPLGDIDQTRELLEKLARPLSAEGAVAAQTLIWKKIEYTFSQCQYGVTEQWCRLALVPLFRNSGPQIAAKFERKLVLCAGTNNDLDLARSVFHAMPEITQNEPMTGYLMFKLAVEHGDRDLAFKSLETVTKATNNKDYLHACVLACQHLGDNVIVIEAMKRLADQPDCSATSPFHLPALLRCMIRLLCTLLDKGGDGLSHEHIAEDICTTFQSVSAAIQHDLKDASNKKLFDVHELEWFCQNSYNLGVKYAGTWHLRHVVSILTFSVNIVNKFPDDISSQVAMDLSLKSIFCHFIISSALVALARTNDIVEERLQNYLVMRKHIAAFDTELQKQQHVLDEVSMKDLLNKLSMLLVFDFEGAVSLKKWEDLGQIVRKASICRCLESFQAMGDCLLRAQPPGKELFSTMRNIINEISHLEGFDSAKLALYMRCLFQAVLPGNDAMAEQLMDETCEMVRDAVTNNVEWPGDELGWMATKAYDHGLEIYYRGQKDECLLWVQKAIELARYCPDGGVLVRTLQEKLHHLTQQKGLN